MSLPKCFWADAINTACHVLNRVILLSILEKTSYETLKGRKPNILYFWVFGYKCFILDNEKNVLGKFNAKYNEGIFLGYSSTSKVYRVYNHKIYFIEELIPVAFDESSPQKSRNDISSDVSGVIIERLTDDESSKEDHTP